MICDSRCDRDSVRAARIARVKTAHILAARRHAATLSNRDIRGRNAWCKLFGAAQSAVHHNVPRISHHRAAWRSRARAVIRKGLSRRKTRSVAHRLDQRMLIPEVISEFEAA